jgi:hypothetical protein
MKTKFPLLAILIIALFSNCSSNEDSTSNSQIQINPPSWIQGTWRQANGGVGFKFTNNDFITILPGSETSQRQLLMTSSNLGASASDESTATTYDIRLNFPAGQSAIYSFELSSDNTLRWDQAASIPLIRQ